MVKSPRIQHLGQTGLRIDLGHLTVLVDPYLSDSVQQLDSPDLQRLIPIPYQPQELDMVDWILITHEHMDHCDPHTIPILADINPLAYFMGPRPVRELLIQWGVDPSRIVSPPIDNMRLADGLSIRAIPAAHPTVRYDKEGSPQCIGYFFEFEQKNLYLAGDTSVCEEIISTLKSLPLIDIALLPVNEDNYYRRRRGIVGNMSIREAFELASEIGCKKVVPVHWDMFAVNSTNMGEIENVYYSRDWPFSLGNVDLIEL